MAKAEIKAPFDLNGNLQHYAQDNYSYSDGSGYTRVGPDWRDNKPFEATLTFNGQHRGRSAAYFEWVDADGHHWPMFMKDLGDLIVRGTITAGVVTARWIVQKRGQNYGLRLATEREI